MKLPNIVPLSLGLAFGLSAHLLAAEDGATPAAAAGDGLNPSILTVDMKKIFESHPRTIEAQKTLHDEVSQSRNADERVAKAAQLRDEIKTLDSKLGLGNLDPAAAEQMRKLRSEKSATLHPLEEEIQKTQAARMKEAQEKAVRMRGEIVSDIEKAIVTAPALNGVAFVFDKSGPTLNGVPFVIHGNPSLDRSGSVQKQIGAENAAVDAVNTAPAQGLRIAVVDMKTVFRGFYKSKEAEDKINAARQTAKAEYDNRVAKMTTATDDLKKLDAQLASSGLSAADRTARTKERVAKATALSAMERDVKEFQSSREKQLQEQATQMRNDIVNEINHVIADGVKAEGHVDLIFDSGGLSLNALPVLLRHEGIPDWTNAAIAALNSGKGGGAGAPIGPSAGSVSTSGLRFAVLDSRRVSQALAASNTAKNDPSGRPVKLPPEMVEKITKAVSEKASSAGIHVVFDMTGPSLNGVPVVMARRTVTDLSNDIIAALGGTAP